MYFKKSSRNIITRPLFYFQLLGGSKPPKADSERGILIFPSPRQALPITSHPKNLKQSTRIADPLAPYSLSDRIIADFLKINDLNKRSYLIHLGYIDDGGILVVDPTNMSAVNERYEPFLNYSGLNAKRFEKLMERRKFRREWYLNQGFSEEEIEKIKIVEDMEAERKAARKNREIIKKNLLTFLRPFYEKHGKNLKVFVLESESSFEYKAVLSSLKKLGALDCLKHKDLEAGENYSSLMGLKKEIKHLLHQSKIEENVKLNKYFKDVDIEFYWPPEFDDESNSYTVFQEEFLKDKKFNVYGKIVNDRMRHKGFIENYKNFLSNLSLDEKEIKKRVETLPSYEPIESLVLKQSEKIGQSKPFTEKLKNSEEGLNILNFFSPSQFSAPCTFSRICQALKVKIYTSKEEEKIFLGNEYHKLILSDPKEDVYINHKIWELAGLEPIPRSFYTEKHMYGKIELDGRKIHLSGLADAILTCDNEIILFEYKLSQVLPEIYKKGHAKQLLAYKFILESLGYKVADVGILLYGIAPPSKPELRSSVTNRYAIFSSGLREEFKEDLKDYFHWVRKIYDSPEEETKKLLKEEIERGCKVCSSDSLVELKKEKVIEAIKEIKQR